VNSKNIQKYQEGKIQENGKKNWLAENAKNRFLDDF